MCTVYYTVYVHGEFFSRDGKNFKNCGKQPEKTRHVERHILHMRTRKKTAGKNDEGKLVDMYSKKKLRRKKLL
jgi:hypothetical protein